MNHFSREDSNEIGPSHDNNVQRNTDRTGRTNAQRRSIEQLALPLDEDKEPHFLRAASSSSSQADFSNNDLNLIPPPETFTFNTVDHRHSNRHIKVYQDDDNDDAFPDIDSAFGGSLVGSSSASTSSNISTYSNHMSRSSSTSSHRHQENFSASLHHSHYQNNDSCCLLPVTSVFSSTSIFPNTLFNCRSTNTSNIQPNSRFSQRSHQPYMTRSMSNLQQQQQQSQSRSGNSAIAPQRSRSSHNFYRVNNSGGTNSINRSSQSNNSDKHNNTRFKKGSLTSMAAMQNINGIKKTKAGLSSTATAKSFMHYYTPSLVPIVNNIKVDTSLAYTIYDYSSYSGMYHPQHICVNEPTQQASRWSSGFHDHEQFITIQFDKPVIARTITFGKFCKGHVCNIKEFKIFGGMHPEDDLRELLHQGLKNDTIPETFPLRYQYKDMIFPIKYLKIVPLAAFGASFNYSIWYVQVQGINDTAIVQAACKGYENYREIVTTRLCLKYFRQKNLLDLFDQLQKKTGISLEHPMVSALHQALVVEAQFEQAEEIVRQMYQQDMFQHYCNHTRFSPVWELINATSYCSKDSNITPCESSNSSLLLLAGHQAIEQHNLSWSYQPTEPTPRGGHQMCIDVQHRKIYLLGGWDGKKDLSDFWCFDINRNRWRLISTDTRMQDGPSPRSCHKICFDMKSRSIFVLGGLIDPKQPINDKMGSSLSAVAAAAAATAAAVGTNDGSNTKSAAKADFYRYFIDLDQWVRISNDLVAEGGPELIYDHQMCVDSKNEVLYVFGGRTQTLGIQNYSGLYSFDIKRNIWHLRRNDDIMLSDASIKPPTSHYNASSFQQPGVALVGKETSIIKSRVGHSMLFDEASRSLLIFAGQRGNDYLTDFYQYYVDYDRVIQVDHQRRHKSFFNKYSNTVLASTTIRKGPGHSVNSQSSNGPPDEFYYTAACGATGSYTQRVTMDEQDQEMFVFSGYVRSNSGADFVKNTFWIYSMKNNEWTRVYHTSDKMSEQKCREREYGQQMFKDSQPWLYVTGPPPSNTGENTGTHNASIDNTTAMQTPSFTCNSSGMAALSDGQNQKKYDETDKEDIYKTEPCPRFAHQMVYDPMEKTHYIFGGNPSDFMDCTRRLNDFWKLKLYKPDPSSILKKCIYKIRLQQLKEFCNRAHEQHQQRQQQQQRYRNSSDSGSKGKKAANTGEASVDYRDILPENTMDAELGSETLLALDFLRTQVAPVVDHDDKDEMREFHKICAALCLLQRHDATNDKEEDNFPSSMSFLETEDAMYIERTKLFEALLEYIPEEMKEPLENLTTNAVKLT
ncbi:Muskelin N-terminus-domain-containing protein [Mycotypha africana]|uniref:Muskelin N-terminus-domain-containing protein n=1 Tax=Mycotypha africana TaxID=64632 RepID=UPI002300F352|nr:Muskelin N-terminus-domain-containing protein [Mycotypha africana]KAI8984520.1 Muskelin N-terminus-domain-containing protein [Mycotypha africana]